MVEGDGPERADESNWHTETVAIRAGRQHNGTDLAPAIHPTSEPISIRLFELGQQWENDKNFHGAEKCYKLAAEKYPADHKAKYTLARIALKQGKLYSAIGELRRLVEIPDAAKQVVVRMLSPRGAARVPL